MFDKIAKLAKCSKVVIDDQKAGFDATQHLIENGCKKIAHIRGPLNPQNSIDRYLGYKKALESNGIPFDSKLVYTCEKVNFEEGLEFTKQLFEEHISSICFESVDGFNSWVTGKEEFLTDLKLKLESENSKTPISNREYDMLQQYYSNLYNNETIVNKKMERYERQNS